jgi:hypothetical protein
VFSYLSRLLFSRDKPLRLTHEQLDSWLLSEISLGALQAWQADVLRCRFRLNSSSNSGAASAEQESAWQANLASSVEKSAPSHPDPNTDATRNSDRAGTSVFHHVEHCNLEPILECAESSESADQPLEATSTHSSIISVQQESPQAPSSIIPVDSISPHQEALAQGRSTVAESQLEIVGALVQRPSSSAQSNVQTASCQNDAPIDLESSHARTASHDLLLPPAPPSPTLSARSFASNASAISVASHASMLSSLSSLSARARATRVQRQMRDCDSPVSAASALSSFCDPRLTMLERADRERRRLLRLAPGNSPICSQQPYATSSAHRDAEQRESFLAPDSTGDATPPPSLAHRVMQQSLDSISSRLRSMQLARALAQSGGVAASGQLVLASSSAQCEITSGRL